MLQVPNRRFHFELEVILQSSVKDFSKMIVKEIPIEQARTLANRFFKLAEPIPKRIGENDAFELIETIYPKSTLEQSHQFYLELIKI